MSTKTKNIDVPDIGNLLGTITSKRENGELGTTEKQQLISIETKKIENNKTFSRENTKTIKSKVGRPTTKNKTSMQYVRMGVVIPKLLKQKVADALNYERFQTGDGQVIKTLDDIVTLALERLLDRSKSNSN